MPEYGLTPFVLLFPNQGMTETRVISTRGFPGLPDDDYGLQDSYCDDPTCHCRRVMQVKGAVADPSFRRRQSTGRMVERRPPRSARSRPTPRRRKRS